MKRFLLSRKAASNILATLVIFLITTVAITLFVVQVNPVLTGLVHEKESSAQKVMALGLADELEKMSLSPVNGVRSLQLTNKYNSYVKLGSGPLLSFHVQDGATSLFTHSLNIGIFNFTTSEGFTGSALQPSYIRGGPALSSMFLNETRDTNSVQVLVGEQQKNEIYRDFLLMRGLLATTLQGSTATLDIFVYQLTFDPTLLPLSNEALGLRFTKTVYVQTTTVTSAGGFTSITFLHSLNGQSLTEYAFPSFTGATTLHINYNLVTINVQLQVL